MASSQAHLGKTLLWLGVSATLFGFLFLYFEEFSRLAHNTADACVVQNGLKSDYYAKATQELCAKQGGTLVAGTWWYVFAPIAMAFALSYSHGMFTGLFWDLLGLKAKK